MNNLKVKKQLLLQETKIFQNKFKEITKLYNKNFKISVEKIKVM